MENLFIGGEYVASHSSEGIEVENPATEETITVVSGRRRHRHRPGGRGGAAGHSASGGWSMVSSGLHCCIAARMGSSSTPTS